MKHKKISFILMLQPKVFMSTFFFEKIKRFYLVIQGVKRENYECTLNAHNHSAILIGYLYIIFFA